MNDTLRYLSEEPIHRQYHHNLLTFSLMYAFSENYLLPISHDEVVHGKGSLLRKIARLPRGAARDAARLPRLHVEPPRQAAALHGLRVRPGGEWADGRSLDWWLLDHAAHYRVHALVKELNRRLPEHPALWELDSAAGRLPRGSTPTTTPATCCPTCASPRHDQQGDVVATVVNFSGDDKAWVRVGRAPRPGRWEVVLDTSGFDEASSPEPGRRRARGRGVAVARPAVLGHRAGRRAGDALPGAGRRLSHVPNDLSVELGTRQAVR